MRPGPRRDQVAATRRTCGDSSSARRLPAASPPSAPELALPVGRTAHQWVHRIVTLLSSAHADEGMSAEIARELRLVARISWLPAGSPVCLSVLLGAGP